MTKTIWKPWLAFRNGAVVLSTAAAVNGQDNVLIPGGPIEYTLQPLADAAKSPPGTYFVLTDDDAKAGEAARAADAAKAAVSGDNPSEYWIGIGLGGLPDIAKQQLGVKDGLVVSEVMDDDPAAKAGFKKNDILVKAGDAPVKAPADLIKAVDASHGKQMIITIVRGGKDRTIEVTPAKALGRNRPPGSGTG